MPPTSGAVIPSASPIWPSAMSRRGALTPLLGPAPCISSPHAQAGTIWTFAGGAAMFVLHAIYRGKKGPSINHWFH